MLHKATFSLIITLSVGVPLSGQIKNQTYSYQHYQKYNDLLYSPDTRFHTASKPFLFQGELLSRFDSLHTTNAVESRNWFMRKIFNEHLVEVKKEDHTFYLDFLPDFVIGTDLIDSDRKSTWLNTRGVQAGLRSEERRVGKVVSYRELLHAEMIKRQ